jgi:hypothetical protein
MLDIHDGMHSKLRFFFRKQVTFSVFYCTVNLHSVYHGGVLTIWILWDLISNPRWVIELTHFLFGFLKTK